MQSLLLFLAVMRYKDPTTLGAADFFSPFLDVGLDDVLITAPDRNQEIFVSLFRLCSVVLEELVDVSLFQSHFNLLRGDNRAGSRAKMKRFNVHVR